METCIPFPTGVWFLSSVCIVESRRPPRGLSCHVSSSSLLVHLSFPGITWFCLHLGTGIGELLSLFFHSLDTTLILFYVPCSGRLAVLCHRSLCVVLRATSCTFLVSSPGWRPACPSPPLQIGPLTTCTPSPKNLLLFPFLLPI